MDPELPGDVRGMVALLRGQQLPGPGDIGPWDFLDRLAADAKERLARPALHELLTDRDPRIQALAIGALTNLPESTDTLDRLLAAIDEQTQLVLFSHVLFRSSFVQDIGAITRRAHEVGALVLADIYQSAGCIPIDVQELGLDFATGGSVKWLCGGPGAAYLYVRRDLWPKLEPRFTGWMAHKRPFAFEEQPIDYAENGFRFLNGTPAIPALYAARAGYEIIAEAGVERIRKKSVRQTSRLIELAREAGFRVNSPENPAERGGTVVIDVPDGAEVARELVRRNFLVDHRPGAGIRVAPHFYSTDDELDLTIREIRAVASERVPAARAR